MTDENPPTNPLEESSAIEKLRSEFQEQFNTMKQSFEKERAENSQIIDSLKKENEELHRALIRSAQMPPAPQEPPKKTEEELYKERISELAKRTIAIEKGEI